MLKDFDKLGFAEKIGLLNEIETNKKIEYIPQLFELYNNPTGDDSIDNILEETLRNISKLKPEELIKRIEKGNEREKIFCIRTSARFNIIETVPALLLLLDENINDKIRYEIIYALSSLKDKRALDAFRRHIGYHDKIISTISIEMIGYFKDEESIVKLIEIINEGETEENYHECSVETAGAIEALANFKSNNTIMFFVKKIHHKNPTARRIIHEKITEIGSDSLSFLKKVFLGNNVDNKILATNLIGRIGDKKGAEILLSVLDKKNEVNANLRYAIYESFGLLKSMKGLIFLTDALEEKDFLVLLAVIHSLDSQINEKIITRIIELILKNNEQSKNLLRAIIHAKAGNIFLEIYKKNNAVSDMMIEQIIESNNDDVLDEFKNIISKTDLERKDKDLHALSDISEINTGVNILAVDDSKAMLMFYRNLGSETGFNIITAGNGAEAMNIINDNNKIELVITDMNMPVMDGTELTRNIRKNLIMKDVPIIMATTESDESQINVAKNSGVNHFIRKPFTTNFLFQTIIEYLKK